MLSSLMPDCLHFVSSLVIFSSSQFVSLFFLSNIISTYFSNLMPGELFQNPQFSNLPVEDSNYPENKRNVRSTVKKYSKLGNALYS